MEKPLISIFPSTFSPLKDCYKEFFKEGVLIASANIIFSQSSVYIMNFETKEKNKGYGRYVIETLLKDYDILGVATKASLVFWGKMGAVFDDYREFIIKRRE